MAALALLGWVVRGGSTAVDEWFQRAGNSGLSRLLFFTDYRTVAVLLVVALVLAAYRRRWRLAILAVATPAAAVWLSRLLKLAFGREKGDAVTYPSGHATLTAVVLGMVILAAGVRLWLVLTSVVWMLLGMVGQAVSYHYFTDTVGAVLLGSSLVCVAALLDGG
ncbi:PA-phosphatase [Mycolicibacterium sp. CBM1]